MRRPRPARDLFHSTRRMPRVLHSPHPTRSFDVEGTGRPSASPAPESPATTTTVMKMSPLPTASVAALVAAFASLAQAQTNATWINNAPTGLWTTSTNWTGGVVPNATADTATFNVATVPTISLGSNIALNRITFGATNQTSTTISDASNTLTITTASFADGIAVSGGKTAIFDVNTTFGLSGGTTQLSVANLGVLTFSSGRTVTTSATDGRLRLTSTGTVNWNAAANFGASATPVVVQAGTLNWNADSLTSTNTGSAIFRVTGISGAVGTLNLQKSLDTAGQVQLGGSVSGNGNNQARVLITTAGASLSDNVNTQAAGTGGASANIFTLGTNIAGAGTGTFAGNYAITDTNARTHVFTAAASNTATFSGVISGSGAGSLFQKTGAGTVLFSGSAANTYNSAVSMDVQGGTLALGKTTGNALTGSVSVASGATLQLNAANQIADASALTLAGGTFTTGGFSETLGALSVSSASVIDLGAGASTLLFSSVSATSGLAFTNWSVGFDSIRVTADPFASLGNITINGLAASSTNMGAYYELTAIPEPSSAAAIAGVSLLGFAALRRRRRSRA